MRAFTVKDGLHICVTALAKFALPFYISYNIKIFLKNQFLFAKHL